MTSYANATGFYQKQNANVKKPFPILRVFVITAITLTIVLLIMDVVRRFLPQQKTETINTDTPLRPTVTKNIEPPSTLRSFQYIGPEATFPKTIPFYSNEKRSMFTIEELSVIASQINLRPSTTQMRWQTENKDATLTYQPSRNIVQYIANSENIQSNIEYEDAVRISDAFLSAISISKTYQPIPEKTLYMKSRGSEPVESSKNDANLIEITYGLTLDTYPIFFESATGPLIKVWVASPGIVVKAEIINATIRPTQAGVGKTLSIEKALENMGAGSYTLLSYLLSGNDVLSATSLQSATFTQVTIVYRVSNEGSSIFPYYHFSGTAIAQSGGKATVEIITPAIETQNASPSSTAE